MAKGRNDTELTWTHLQDISCTNNILHQGTWCWGFMLIDSCRLTDVSARTAELGHGCLTLEPGWEETWTPLQLLLLLPFTDGLFTSCYRHNSSLTLGEELASISILSRDFLTQSGFPFPSSPDKDQSRLKDSSDCTSDPQPRPRYYYFFLRYGEEMAHSSGSREEKGEIWNNWSLPQRKTIQKNFLLHTFKPIQGEQFRCQGFHQLPLTIMSIINTWTVTPD